MKDKLFKDVFEYKVIYIFTIDDDLHKGLIKIGDATIHTESDIYSLHPNSRELNQAALKRIKSYTTTVGVVPKLLWTEIAIRNIKGKGGINELEAFRDYQVHSVLKNSNINPKKLGNSREWFEIDLEVGKLAINAVKLNYSNLSNTNVNTHHKIEFRPEQKKCIEKVKNHFKKHDKFLINAKMRYGKTLVSLEIIKRCNFNKTIIMTHRPVVDDSWYDDFTKIFYGTNYVYGSKSKGYTVDELLSLNKPFIYFASVQDLRGSSTVGGKFNKNIKVFETVWDCCVVDEAHEGTTTSLGEETVKAIFKQGSGTKYLALSGTPFNIIQDYDEDSIYTWDYIMEQECKNNWDLLNFGDSNPYDELPELRIYTYSLGDIINKDKFRLIEEKAFNFKEFFRTYTKNDDSINRNINVNSNIGEFVHKDDIWEFLNLMTRSDKSSNYPYSNEEYRNLFKHSLWIVPGVKEAKALKKLMLKHPVFGCGRFNIINVAGRGDEEEEYEEALARVRNGIREAGDDYTITLSCGKLTTGVTVKEWSAVFMLSGSYSTSAANYLQTIFRVQSPCNNNGRIKRNAYVFDFAPDRALKMVSCAVMVSSKAGKTKASDKKIIGKFLNYCPVISITGSQMKEFSAQGLLQQLKRAYAEKVVKNGFDDINLYNDELFRLKDVDIEKFNELKGIIGASKAQGRQKEIILNSQGLTDEEREEAEILNKRKKLKKNLTEEEKQRLEDLKKIKKMRSDAISILRGISIRMPLLIYGADINYDEDITLDKFVDIIDDSSWNEFMPAGITKEKFNEFKKYYDEEVFIAAGRRIRNIAKEADSIEPTERVIKIASLFSYFKNPDKETVLTPWRVVNMHMSDCLGGWDFWDELHENILEVPRFVDRGEVTANTFSKKNSQILEINSKTGLYPLYIAYSCYRTKLEFLDKKILTIVEKHALWHRTIEENLFIICKTPMAKTITKRTLLGYSKGKFNAHCFDDLLNMIQNKPEQFRKRVLRGSFWGEGVKKMTFDSIVGNPPYMKMDDGAQASAKPIYNNFVEASIALNPKFISFIMPTRWYAGGKGLDNFRDKMLSDIHLKELHDCLSPEYIFPNTNIRGGVCYFLWQKSYDNSKELLRVVTHDYEKILSDTKRPLKIEGADIFIRFSEAISILEKVKLVTSENMDGWVSPRKPFGISSAFSKSKDFLYSPDKNHNIECLGKGLQIGYVSEENVTSHKEWIYKWKVFIPRANNIGTELIDDNMNTYIGKPGMVCTEAYIAIGIDKLVDLESSVNLSLYMRTKFARFMHSLAKASQDATAKTFVFVPVLDFSKTWTDEKLYKYFNLSNDEINFIENKIKEMK